MELFRRLPHIHYALNLREIGIRAIYPATQHAPDHVDEIAIATIYLMVIMILAVLIRLAFRLHMLRSLEWDDGTISLALQIFAVAQCAVILVGTEHGLGKRKLSLNDTEVQILEKVLYSSNILYVLALNLAKISVLLLLNRLAVNRWHKKILFWTSVLVGIWTVPVFFTLAFQCGVPEPWDASNGHCIDIFAFWAGISPIDIITELVICILPIYIVKPVQVIFGKKVTVVVAFFIRIFVVITTIIRLIFMRYSKPYPSTDMNDAAFATTITTECVLCVSIMTACIPCLKPFLDAFDSGMLNVSLHKRIGGGSNSNSYGNTYALTSMTKGVKESATRSRYLEDEIEGLGTSAAAFAVTSPGQPLGRRDSTLVIQRTDQWSVRCEYVGPKDGSVGDETEQSERNVARCEHSL
ncbi:Major Facilitator Superfamily protein [Aspergillus niger]|uniref:Major Facilitator Superfamily protein n=1 Tax=Aspergillus niger TaxID=5061 RepID=A0A505IH52_ASPNG|nr:Major Facilitator Superfamily protein [Aspergillus niger]